MKAARAEARNARQTRRRSRPLVCLRSVAEAI